MPERFFEFLVGVSYLLRLACYPFEPKPAEPVSPAAEKPDMALEVILSQCAKNRKEIAKLHCQGVLTRDDRVLNLKRPLLRFEFWYARPALRRFDWRDDEGNRFAAVLAKGKKETCYNFDQHIKFSCSLQHLNKPSSNWITSLFAGMTYPLALYKLVDIGDATAGPQPWACDNRFKIRLLREDEHYACLTVKPRENTWESGVYSNLVVTLDKKTWFLKTAQLTECDGTQARLDLTMVERNQGPEITLETLSKDLPRGWK
jgi:outer membrane lipoprotein-sorting protein